MSRIPSTCSKSEGAISSSFFPILSLLPLLSATARTIIGTESKLPEITRGEASLGSKSETSLSAAFSLSVTASVVVPYSNDTRRTERPVVEVTVVDSIPSRPNTTCSRGEETWLSTTSGDAPGYEVTTAAEGISIEGISSCFRPPTEMNPNAATMTVTRATTERFLSESLEIRYKTTSYWVYG